MDVKFLLPEELLPQIFAYLPLDDRKNVRLTCRLWNAACNRATIIRHEKFVIRFDRNENDVAYIALCIIKCENLRANLEFQGFPLKHFPRSVWEHSGDKIVSLFIYECDVDDQTIKNIIIHCSNLSSFYLRSSIETRSGNQVFCSETFLDDLISWKIERKKLLSFQLYLYIQPEDPVYRKLFQIYPNIRTFGCGHCDSIRKFSKELQLPQVTETFIYESNTDGSWMVPYCKNPKMKFKELRIRITLSPEYYTQNIVKDFFSGQTDLMKLELYFSHEGEGEGEGIKSLLFQILKNCPKLKKIHLYTDYSINLSVAESAIFLKEVSHFESLSLSVECMRENRFDNLNSTELSPLMSYTELTKLRLPFSNGQVFLALLDRCRSLQCLHLEHVSVKDKTLHSMLENHIALKKLCIHFKIEASRNTFSRTIRGNPSYPSFLQLLKRSLNCLQNLEYLEIRGLTHHLEVNGHVYDTFDELLSEMNFPNLKYLYFETFRCRNKLSVLKLLDIVSSRAPSLEMLRLDSPLYLAWNKSDLLCENEMIDYCQRLKKLKCLIINPFFPEEHYSPRRHPVQQLFVKCPSLTYVSGYGRKYGKNLAFYCRFLETLKWYQNFTLETMEWYPDF